MKKMMIGCLALLTACSHPKKEGLFVRHFKNQYSSVDDTIQIKDGIVIRRTGFNKIRDGKLKHRAYETESWRLNEWGSIVIVFDNNGILVGNSKYKSVD